MEIMPRENRVAKTKDFKEKYGGKFEFPEGWGPGCKTKHFHCMVGPGMDIFLDQTMIGDGHPYLHGNVCTHLLVN